MPIRQRCQAPLATRAILRPCRRYGDPAPVPRKPRPTVAGFYHVATRSLPGEQLFRDDHDFARFLSGLRELVAAEECKCVCFCLMTTHYHLLLGTGAGGPPRTMQRLNQAYAIAYNARYGRRGHAFSERYLATLILDDEHLLTAFRYIVRNPVEAGLCERPEEWEWSSYRSTVGLAEPPSFVDATIVVELCGGPEGVRDLVEGGQRCQAPRSAVPGT